jgi:hypothetical protein
MTCHSWSSPRPTRTSWGDDAGESSNRRPWWLLAGDPNACQASVTALAFNQPTHRLDQVANQRSTPMSNDPVGSNPATTTTLPGITAGPEAHRPLT